MEGAEEWALQELLEVRVLLEGVPRDAYWDLRRGWAAAFIACLERGEPLKSVLDPMTEAGKAAARIVRVKRPAVRDGGRG